MHRGVEHLAAPQLEHHEKPRLGPRRLVAQETVTHLLDDRRLQKPSVPRVPAVERVQGERRGGRSVPD